MLADLVAGAAKDARIREERIPYAERVAQAEAMAPVLPEAALRPMSGSVGIIAEIKRASPSKGPLADIPDPVWLAQQYEAGGASAISVLTESRKFLGSLDDLAAVTQSVTIPVLRKDFLSNRYQVVEARAHGASMVLLIMASLDDGTAQELLTEARYWGMGALVEAHSAEEVSRAVDLGADVIGINARDLTTFEVDISLFGRLRSMVPAGVVAVAESAVSTPDDVARYRLEGADYVLVGEALVTGANPQQTVREFLAS